MPSIPKPQPCGQNWLAMTPTANGRHCGQCHQEIYDFSTSSWPEIERVQAAHGHSLCGMYTPAQLRHWGQPPAPACPALAAATALALSLASQPAPGQALPPATTDSLRITGTVMAVLDHGQPEPLPGVTVLVRGTRFGTSTDGQGRFTLVLPPAVSQQPGSTLLISSVGFSSSSLALPSAARGALQHDVVLTPSTTATVFAIERPSLARRLTWRLRQWLAPSR